MAHIPRTRHQSASELASVRMKGALAALDWPLLTRLCRQTLRKMPNDLMGHRLLGFSLTKQRQLDDALKAFRRAIAIWPDDGELIANFGNLLIEQAMNAEALPLLERLCILRPDKAVCWNEFAHCCYALGLHEKGLEAAEKAAELAADVGSQVTALTQKAIHRRELGQIKEAVRDCETAIALYPNFCGSHTNRMLFMLADPDANAKQLARAAEEYAEIFEQPLRVSWPDFSSRCGNVWRRLRIGFVSPDFRGHPVMYFVEGLLAQLDRRQFEVFAFSLYPKEDPVTNRVRHIVDHFIRIDGHSPEEQTRAVLENEIDVLIDLAGHTGHNGLLVFARKAAPVQISWLGYPATTGLTAIDYKFTDEVTDPMGADEQYSERLYRLPTFFACYRPLSRDPIWRYQPRYLVRPTPALANGYITFGSCNNLGKLTDDVLSLWGKILDCVPDSRLLIEGKNLDRPDFLVAYKARCERLGLDPKRIDFEILNSNNQYLTYHKIDIALDPFPLTGGTTSFDLLWMGVPMVSMCGDSFKSRMGTGMLTYLGRTEWLAQNTEEYIRIASELAKDVDSLNATRLGLRAEVESSVLMREDLFCHHFGDALRTVWLQWQAEQLAPGDVNAQLNFMNECLAQFPAEWQIPAIPGVGLEPGNRVTIHDAHQRLEHALAKAKSTPPNLLAEHGKIESRNWIGLTQLAETVLSSVPHDPVALSCLAEVEFAHGHTDFAVTYLRYAADAMAKQAQIANAGLAAN